MKYEALFELSVFRASRLACDLNVYNENKDSSNALNVPHLVAFGMRNYSIIVWKYSLLILQKQY